MKGSNNRFQAMMQDNNRQMQESARQAAEHAASVAAEAVKDSHLRMQESARQAAELAAGVAAEAVRQAAVISKDDHAVMQTTLQSYRKSDTLDFERKLAPLVTSFADMKE